MCVYYMMRLGGNEKKKRRGHFESHSRAAKVSAKKSAHVRKINILEIPCTPEKLNFLWFAAVQRAEPSRSIAGDTELYNSAPRNLARVKCKMCSPMDGTASFIIVYWITFIYY